MQGVVISCHKPDGRERGHGTVEPQGQLGPVSEILVGLVGDKQPHHPLGGGDGKQWPGRDSPQQRLDPVIPDFVIQRQVIAAEQHHLAPVAEGREAGERQRPRTAVPAGQSRASPYLRVRHIPAQVLRLHDDSVCVFHSRDFFRKVTAVLPLPVGQIVTSE